MHADIWSDWVDAQANLCLCWAHMPFCWFCHEAVYFFYDGYCSSAYPILFEQVYLWPLTVNFGLIFAVILSHLPSKGKKERKDKIMREKNTVFLKKKNSTEGSVTSANIMVNAKFVMLYMIYHPAPATSTAGRCSTVEHPVLKFTQHQLAPAKCPPNAPVICNHPYPSPTYGEQRGWRPSIIALLKALHCGDLLRVIALLFIIVNSTRVYLCNITSPPLTCHRRGTKKVTAPHISPAIPTGFKLAQKFREKWLLPPGKIGRSFIGQERS